MKKLDSLQYARALAAMFVVVAHTVNQFHLYSTTGNIFFDEVIRRTTHLGDIGVYIFFVISGYIMSYTTKNKDFGLKYSSVFIKKRIVRIYPLYWIFLTLLVFLWAIGIALKSQDIDVGKIIFSYLLIPYGVTGNKIDTPVMSQSWTLSYEMFFYITFCFLIFFNVKKEKISIYLTLIFSTLFIAASYNLLPSIEANLFFSKWLIFLFIAGVAIERNESYFQNLTGGMSDASCWLMASTFVLIAIYIEKPVYLDCIISTFIMLLILPVRNKHDSLLKIGDASYTIYLTHNFVVMTYGIFVKKVPNAFVCATVGVATILLCVPFGLVLYRLVEKRIHQ
ncbi:acyltransferase family protein [Serratia sp. NPDC087055]|uniref:acyltransferase family protein n=1 Tax=Serratia sp. NPDC087055 TaxID=3364516 RepID=UPI003850DA4E